MGKLELEWERYEGAAHAYDANGDMVIEIDALQNEDECTKWGETYTPGRAWRTLRSGVVVASGRADTLPAARKAALATLHE